jgi:2-dehydro-3-deoxyphosphooctonate aldolase (KDO 8-P synthase)
MRIIAGPCQHESLSQSAQIAVKCKAVCDKHGAEYYFKASFDKANRSSLGGVRGHGLESTLDDFRLLKEVHGVNILTDVHTVEQINQIVQDYNDVVDVLQTACETDKIVNIKKGQFLAPWDMKGILSKCTDATELWITERGTSFGYNTLVVDFTGINYMLDNFDYDLVLDATHSVQKPGGNGTSSGGNRDYVPGLCRAGSALGVRSFFLEVHPNPDNAPSDGPNMLRLDNFERTVDEIHSYSYTG